VVSQQIKDLDLPQGVLIVTIDRSGQSIVPQGTTIIFADDSITLLANQQQLAEARDRFRAAYLVLAASTD